MTSSYSLNKPKSFSEEGYTLWKNKVTFFIEGMDHGNLKALKEGPFFLIHKINGVVLNKPEKDLIKYDK